jgi:hypothetical protein
MVLMALARRNDLSLANVISIGLKGTTYEVLNLPQPAELLFLAGQRPIVTRKLRDFEDKEILWFVRFGVAPRERSERAEVCAFFALLCPTCRDAMRLRSI